MTQPLGRVFGFCINRDSDKVGAIIELPSDLVSASRPTREAYSMVERHISKIVPGAVCPEREFEWIVTNAPARTPDHEFEGARFWVM